MSGSGSAACGTRTAEPDTEALLAAWDALGYLVEWCYPDSSHAVIDACAGVAGEAFGRLSDHLGLAGFAWPLRERAPSMGASVGRPVGDTTE